MHQTACIFSRMKFYSLQSKLILPLAPSGKYEINDACYNGGPFEITKQYARCDMDTDGGGWLVIQRRIEGGTVDFYRKWEDYEEGFGNLDTEFWYGLRNLHCLTTREEMELQIDLEDENGNQVTWRYQEFRVAGSQHLYRLHLRNGQGTAGIHDGMAYHNGQSFSTYDQDNDANGHNCAIIYGGGWWYKSCHEANLNGPHTARPQQPGQHAPTPNAGPITWGSTAGGRVYYPKVEMKIRPKTCSVQSACEETQ